MSKTVRTYEYALTYKGEVMLNPIYRTRGQAQDYIDNAELLAMNDPADYGIVTRSVVTTAQAWREV